MINKNLSKKVRRRSKRNERTNAKERVVFVVKEKERKETKTK